MDLDVSIRRKHLPVAVFSEHSHMFNQWGDHRITKGIERQKGAVRGILRTLSYFTVTSLNAVLLGPKSQDQNPRVPPHFLFSLNTFFFFWQHPQSWSLPQQVSLGSLSDCSLLLTLCHYSECCFRALLRTIAFFLTGEGCIRGLSYADLTISIIQKFLSYIYGGNC